MNFFAKKHAAMLIIFALCGVVFAQPKYYLTELAPYDKTHFVPAISETGVGVGYAIPNPPKATSWQDGQPTDLNAILGASSSGAEDINAAGTIVGGVGGTAFRAFRIANGVGTIYNEAEVAYGLNALDQWVGIHATSNTAAILWDPNNGFTDLEIPGAAFKPVARAINDHGLIAGMEFFQSQQSFQIRPQGVVWTQSGSNWVHEDLPPGMGHTSSSAYAVNNYGVVVGESNWWLGAFYWGAKACIWQKVAGQWEIRLIEPFSGGNYSKAFGINNRNQIVGWSNKANLQNAAFLWDNGVMYDLNDLVDLPSTWKYLDYAYDISDSGYIVGQGVKTNNFVVPFILRPDVSQSLCE